MFGMVLDAPNRPLRAAELPLPDIGQHDILLRVRACGVCRTDLHIVDGDLPFIRAPLVPGHEIVGTVEKRGAQAARFQIGERAGVPWLGGACGHCDYCNKARENLCDHPTFTGYHLDGGYAEFAVADERFCFTIPAIYDDAHAAPLLCAGLIGYRAYAMTENSRRLGLYGFGAAAHILTQLAIQQRREVFAFTRPGDHASQRFALALGAQWAGDSDTLPPSPLDAAILFAPVGALVPQALRAVRKGGIVVCAGIHMTDIPAFPYELLWGERIVRSVANLTRADGLAFFDLAARIAIQTRPVTFPLREANRALEALRRGEFDGAAVLVP